MRCHFIPGYLLERLAALDDEELAQGVRHTHAIDQALLARRTATPTAPPATTHEAWEIHTAANGSTLPGELLCTADHPASDDVSANQAAVGLNESLALYAAYGRSSYDDKGATVVTTVHYEKDYDNAFWDGSQLVFGDGDGKIFGPFTKPIDVLGHEFTHAVTQYTADLTYQGQSGALNESVSDCFGSCIKQRHLGQDAAQADWLIGEGIFMPGIQGKALRSMSAPGTAYDDPQLGKDPQVATMADYVETTADNGGVHTNSGIPNKAFYLAATGIGGDSWDGAGQIWYDALTSGIPADTDFAGFAQATVDAAGPHAEVVTRAWAGVGVTPGASASTPTPAPTPAAAVRVARTGGFAGMVKQGEVRLDSDDPRAPEVRDLVDRIDFAAVPQGEPGADRFVYDFECGPQGCQVHEQALTPELRRLAQIVLDVDI